MKKILVVGSGLSGYIALNEILSKKNLKKKFEITLIDNSQLDIKKSIKENELNEFLCKIKGFNLQKSFENFGLFNLKNKNYNLTFSNLIGGLSNVWSGATILSKSKKISKLDNNLKLDEYYNELTSKLYFAVNKDFKKESKNKLSNFSSKKISSLSEKFINSFKNNKNYSIRESSIMIDEIFYKKSKKHRSLNVKYEIQKLINQNKIKYLSKCELLSFKELGTKVNLDIKINNKLSMIEFNKVFICAGALNTVKIINNSLKIHKKIKILETRSFKFPLFYLGKFVNLDKDNNDNFPEIFISENSNDKIFFQLKYDPLFLCSYLKNKFILFKAIPNKLLKILTKRVLIVWGYLDTDNTDQDLFYNCKDNNFITKQKNRKIDKNKIKNFIKTFSKKGFFGFNLLINIAKIGESNHLGGSFPMSFNPNINNTDTLGRPYRFNNVHIVDSSVLQKIDTGPISMKIMANCLRVVRESLKEIK